MLSEEQIDQALQGFVVVRSSAGIAHYGHVTKASGRGMWFEGSTYHGLLTEWVKPEQLSFPENHSLEEIRSAIVTRRMVIFTLWSPAYLYGGVIAGELTSMETPDGAITPIFCFEGKRLGQAQICGNFPVMPRQIYW